MTKILFVFWAAGLLIGGFDLYHHQWSAGPSAKGTPTSLSGLHSARSRLLLFLHPQCPCSHATVAELAKILSAAPHTIECELYFYRPKTREDSWCRSDLWNQASELPDTALREDIDGLEAAHFGAHTSGQVLLYASSGRLVFSGGITDGRGHEGDNDGEDAIVAYLRTGRLPAVSTPVFGCVIR